MAAVFRQILEYLRGHKDVWFAHHHEVAKWIASRSSRTPAIRRASRRSPFSSLVATMREIGFSLARAASARVRRTGAGALADQARENPGAHRAGRHRGRAGAAVCAASEQVARPQFYVENRGGAGNVLGIESVVRSPADGYTLCSAPAPSPSIISSPRNCPMTCCATSRR